ncbi:hypothetical protein JXA85_06015 [Candidatus Woesearchaeota archaeon]|nr:hypothetical protein [Candidatus Woesearchaeota archaeon]
MKKKGSVRKDVAPEKYFMVIDGSTIRSIEELADAFDRMSDDSFFYHVNEYKNDFETWVRQACEDNGLADELHLARNPDKAQIVVLRHMIKKLKK